MTLPCHGEPAALRVLELFGPSSAGKSSLARRLLAGGAAGGRAYSLASDRLLERAGLGRVRGHLARTLALDVLLLPAFFATWRSARGYYAFSAAYVLRGRHSASLRLRLNLIRNAWKAVALRLVAPRFAAPGEVLVLDEGPLQTANYLFVHADSAPAAGALEAFLRAVPLPDAAVYVRADEDELVRRTLERGHPRVPAGSRAASACFVRHALAVFDRIAAEPRVRERLLPQEGLGHPAPALQKAAS